MRKISIAAIVAATVISLSPALAQTGGMMDCSEANMTKASADVGKMPAGEKKTMAMKEMTMAKEMMDKKDMAGCKTHMDKMMGMMK